MIRVAFILGFTDADWMGGLNYFRNLLTALTALPDRKIEPVVFTGKKYDPDLLANFSFLPVVHSSLFDRWHPLWIIRSACRQLIHSDVVLEFLLLKHNVTILSHSLSMRALSHIPQMGWIPDFQHIHLPEYFTEQEVEYRNRTFNALAKKCETILVSSYAARQDFISFSPEYEDKIRVLQFKTTPDISHNLRPIEKLQQCYKFNGPYFHVPNQFWAHKNHRILLKALKILKDKGHHVLVLATGHTHDHRNPDFFNELIEYAERCDVLGCFKVLGVVPYNDLVALMIHAVALINPSFFEGWSTTVEEGKALGKKIILSDIAVHREQSPRRKIFFDPQDPNMLAEKLWRSWENYDRIEEAKQFKDACASLPSQQQSFARHYQAIVLETMAAVI